MVQILEIFFNPQMAIARLGSSETPLESCVWSEDPSLFGAGRTVIRPATSLEVQSDGSVRPYLPSFIRFRDGDDLRPVAPFFELWARIKRDLNGPIEEVPLTLVLLEEAGGSLEGVTYHVTAANRKAQRRTGDPACSFVAGIDVRGTDFRRRELLATSPRKQGVEPLVPFDHPISLGFIQAIKPIRALRPPDDAAGDPSVKPAVEEMGVDLGVLRLRFTPARGEVYGPPDATVGPSPTSNRIHEIVPQRNRTLNPKSTWLSYDADYSKFANPEPSDTYDGASITGELSWGVVDDTCDLLIRAFVVINGVRLQSVARAFVGPPDYAPDRRPFVSLADVLADREKEFVEDVDDANDNLTIAEVVDLFQRVFETVSLTNLDQLRRYSINENIFNEVTKPQPPLPLTDEGTMTKKDTPYANDKLTTLVGGPAAPHIRLAYATAAKQIHEDMADTENLISFLENTQRVLEILRPPYARLRELKAQPNPTPDPNRLRDARNPRDNAQDMRMPPYMRSDTATALSLTRRQYDEVVKLTRYLSRKSRERSDEDAVRRKSVKRRKGAQAAVQPTPQRARPNTALWQHVERVVNRHNERRSESDDRGPSEQDR